MKIVSVENLTDVYIKIAEALGAPPDEAKVFADCMVRADLRGMFTQGASMIPYSVWMVEERLMNFGVPFEVLKDEPGLALVDGHHGVGAVMATRGMDLAIEKAKNVGVGTVWIRNGGDFMMTANHALQTLEHDMVGVVMRNENPRVAPWGGKDPFFFTNPIAVSVPTAEMAPIVIDTAAGSFSVGQTVMTARDKRLMPSPHLVTPDGEYTDDPTKIVVDTADRESAFEGAIVTLGHKGLMWALIIELFSGLLAGTNTSNLNDFEPTGDKPWDEAMFLMAIDVSKLQTVAEFKAGTDRFVRALKAVEPAQGFKEVNYPGEFEAANEEKRRREGIPIRDEVWDLVVETATKLGVAVDF